MPDRFNDLGEFTELEWRDKWRRQQVDYNQLPPSIQSQIFASEIPLNLRENLIPQPVITSENYDPKWGRQYGAYPEDFTNPNKQFLWNEEERQAIQNQVQWERLGTEGAWKRGFGGQLSLGSSVPLEEQAWIQSARRQLKYEQSIKDRPRYENTWDMGGELPYNIVTPKEGLPIGGGTSPGVPRTEGWWNQRRYDLESRSDKGVLGMRIEDLKTINEAISMGWIDSLTPSQQEMYAYYHNNPKRIEHALIKAENLRANMPDVWVQQGANPQGEYPTLSPFSPSVELLRVRGELGRKNQVISTINEWYSPEIISPADLTKYAEGEISLDELLSTVGVGGKTYEEQIREQIGIKPIPGYAAGEEFIPQRGILLSGWQIDDMGDIKTPNGWIIGETGFHMTPGGKSITEDELVTNPQLLKNLAGSYNPQDIEDIKLYADKNAKQFISQMRGMKISSEAVSLLMAMGLDDEQIKKIYPDYAPSAHISWLKTSPPMQVGEGGKLVSMYPATTEEIETGIRPETGYPWNAPPTKWQEFEDAFTKYWAKEKQQGEDWAKRVLEGSMPERVKNIGKWLATQVLVPQQITEALNLYDLVADVWRLGVSSFFRDEPYTLWEPPDWTNLMTTAGVIPGKEYTLGAKEIIDISNPINWITFGGTAQAITPTERLTGEIAAKFITGTSRKEVLTFARKEASKLGIKAEPIIAEAEARVIKALQRQIAPKEVTVPVTKVAKPNEPFEAGMVKQADGTFAKTEKVTFREIKEGDAIPDVGSPERYDDPLTGKTYVLKTSPEKMPEELTIADFGIAPKELGDEVISFARRNNVEDLSKVKIVELADFVETIDFRRFAGIPNTGERSIDWLIGKYPAWAKMEQLWIKYPELARLRSAAQGERVMAGQMPASFENVPSEIRASRRLVAERMFLNGESQEQVIKTLSLDMPEDSAKWLADDVQRGLEKSEFVERRQAQITTEAERRGSVAPEAKPPETPAAVVGKGRAEIIEKSIKAEIDIKKEQARAAVQDAWDAFKQTGITANLKENTEKQANLYTALVELARVHIEAGVKTIEEFARLVGIEINAAVRAAWGTAQKGKVASFDSLTSNTKKSLSNVKMIIRQQFNTEERAAVDNLIATSKKFDEIWETTTAERQAELARKTARLEKAQQEFEGIERIAEENKARAGLLTDIGLTEREMVITSENAKVLEGMIYKSSELDVWEKANAARAMRALVEDWRIPRPFEREYFKKVFGYDAVGIFSQSTKPRLGDYFTEVLYNSFISLKSNVVNFGGNAIASILSPVEKFGAAMMEAPLARMGGRARQRFMGEAVQDLVGAWTGIPDGVRAWLEVMKSGQISGTALKAEMTRPRAFKGKLGRVINFNTDLMYAFDELFKSINKSAAIRSEAYRMASKEGFRGNNLYGRLNVLINDSPEELIKSANKISEYRLFRAQSDFANSIMKLRDIEIGKGVKPIQLIIPFVKTPVNLAKFGIERSPMAIFNPKLINNLIKKNPEASDLLARWAMGTIVALAVTIYARDGLITGAAPRTVGERDEFYRLGKQPYSLKIGNKWISYQRLEPFNQMFLQASVIADSLADKDKNLDELAEGFAFGILQNITNQTFLTGVSDTLNALVEPDRYGEGYFQRMLANLMPGSSTARLMAQTVDTTVRAPQTFVEQIESNIPGLSQKVNPKINIFGEPQTRETPALMPYAYSTEKDDKITKVMADAGVSPGFVGDSITDGKKKYKLNEQELYNYQVLAGQILKKKMISVIGNKSKVSADVLNNAIQEARAIAKQEELRILKRAGRKPDAE